MNGIQFLIGSILPYITVIVFTAGMIYRIKVWSKMPKPKMTLYPRPDTGIISQVLRDVFLFPTLFKSNKTLWAGAWIFHISLFFIFIGHFRVVTDFPWLWNLMGMSPEAVDKMSMTSGGIAGIIIMLSVIFLIFRRIGVQRVREISGFGDYLVMFIILAILMTGNYMRFFQHFDLNDTRTYFFGLATFSSFAMPTSNMFVMHFFLGQLLIIFVPFSKILHLGGIFFSQTVLKRI